MDSWVPTHSSTASAPIPFVSTLIWATPSSPRSVTMSVAPNSRANFCRDLWRLIAMTRPAPFLLRREHTQEADRPVTDDRDRHARLNVGRVCSEPASAHHVGECQEARDQVVRRKRRGGHQGAVRKRDTQQRRLRPAHKLLVLAGRLVSGVAVRTRVIGGEERTDDELAWFDRGDCATDLLDDAAVLVPHRGRLGNGLNAAIGPQVRPAYARSRYPDHRIRRFHDRRGGALLETHIARTVENSSSHGLAPCLSRHARNKAAANGLALLARSGPSFLRNRADNHERHGAVMILSLSVRCSRRPRRARDRLRSLRRGCKARERQRQFPRLGQVARSTDLLRCLSWPLAPWPTCPQPSAYRWSWAHCVDADTPGGIFERSTLRQPDHSVLGCMVPPDGVRSMPGADAWARCAASGPCAQARGDHADPSPSQNMMSKMQ